MLYFLYRMLSFFSSIRSRVYVILDGISVKYSMNTHTPHTHTYYKHKNYQQTNQPILLLKEYYF